MVGEDDEESLYAPKLIVPSITMNLQYTKIIKNDNIENVNGSANDLTRKRPETEMKEGHPLKRIKIADLPKETDPKRLAARQKQIDYGKNTRGYERYVAVIPKKVRKIEDPKTPRKDQICSKRSWDGQISKWRRLLHKYDPEVEAYEVEETDL